MADWTDLNLSNGNIDPSGNVPGDWTNLNLTSSVPNGTGGVTPYDPSSSSWDTTQPVDPSNTKVDNTTGTVDNGTTPTNDVRAFQPTSPTSDATTSGNTNPVSTTSVQNLADGAISLINGSGDYFTYDGKTAPYGSVISSAMNGGPNAQSSTWDTIMGKLGDVSTDTWANLVGKAIGGLFGAAQAKAQNNLRQQELNILKSSADLKNQALANQMGGASRIIIPAVNAKQATINTGIQS